MERSAVVIFALNGQFKEVVETIENIDYILKW